MQLAMPDYYPALARTVMRLPNNNAAARQELYELARSKIVEILLRRDMKVSAPEIARERAALETAISRVEEEFKSVHTRASKGPSRNRPTTPVVENGDVDNAELRDRRLGEDEAEARPTPSRSDKISARTERDAVSKPARDRLSDFVTRAGKTAPRRPADTQSRKTINPHGVRGVDDRGAMMDRCRDLIELYATRLGDDITGPMLIGIVFAIGMMVFTGLMYATIMLAIRFVL